MKQQKIKLLRAIRDIFHCDKLVRHIKIHHEAGVDLCFLNCASSIAENPGISQDKLACMLMLNKSTVARNMAYLEEHGYVKREQSLQDKRIVEIYPTDKMRDILPVVNEKLEDWRDELLKDFSDEEKKLYFEMTQRALNNAQSYVDKIRGCKK